MKNAKRQHEALSDLIDKDLSHLTAGEWRILLMLANDQRNGEIAESLYIHTRSVETYINRIGSKLGVTGRDNLSRTARKNKEMLQNAFAKYYAA